MFNYLRFGVSALGLLSCASLAQADELNANCDKDAKASCGDIIFTRVADFNLDDSILACQNTPNKDFYTIQNVSPVTLTFTVPPIERFDTITTTTASFYVVGGAIPDCVTLSDTLLPGQKCNIGVSIVSNCPSGFGGAGVLDRLLVIEDIPTSQIDLVSPPIDPIIRSNTPCTLFANYELVNNPSVADTNVVNVGTDGLGGDICVNSGTALVDIIGWQATNGPNVNYRIDPSVNSNITSGALADAQSLSTDLNNLPCPDANNLTGKVLGVDITSLDPGVYCFDGNATLNGTLTLTFTDPDEVVVTDGNYIFQIAGNFTTTTGSQIGLAGGVPLPPVFQAEDFIFWNVGGFASIGLNSSTSNAFIGQLLVEGNIMFPVGTPFFFAGNAFSFGSGSMINSNGHTSGGTNTFTTH